MSTLQLRRVNKAFDTTHVIHDVDLAIGEEVTYELRVSLQEGTWNNVVVADILPEATQGTLEFVSATIMMMAERGADFLLERPQLPAATAASSR